MFKLCLRAMSAGVVLASAAFAQLGITSGGGPSGSGAPYISAAPIAFEVATVKLAPPMQQQALAGKMHIGLNVDGARADIGGLSLADLIAIAYKVKSHQVVGPDWLAVDRFDIMGKIPEGATKDQVPDMLQSLLVDRFKLKFHLEDKEHAVYALVVAKGGPKMKESPPDDPPPAESSDASANAVKDKDKDKSTASMSINGQTMSVKQTGSGAEMSGGPMGKMKMTMQDGHMRMEFVKATMPMLAEVLSRFVDKPVMDMTDLKGNYQIALELSMEDLQNVARAQGMQIPGTGPGAGAGGSKPAEASDPAGSSIFSTVAQMGLKLEARKQTIPVITIDHLEKAPTEN